MINGVMFQSFEWHSIGQGFYANLAKAAPELAKRGINAIWLPPMCKGMSGGYDVGYGCYDLFDLGEFDQKATIGTKYGSKEELLACIETLHQHGFQVYADVVLNHKCGADALETFMAVKVNPENRLEKISDPYEIEAWTGFSFPGRAGKYSDFQWHWYHFTGVDFDNRTGEKAIFKIVGDQKDWAQGVSSEKGNFDYLMHADIDHAHPEVREEIFRWTTWLLEQTHVDGFRLDAVKHIDESFIRDFCLDCRRKFGQDFYIFGEYWQNNSAMTERYLEETAYQTAIFDVALHFNLMEAARDGNSFDLRTIFDNTTVKESPQLAVTFVDNHDSQPDQSLSSWVEGWFKEAAYALILLRKDGYPCVFAGDYYGLNLEQREHKFKYDIDRLLFIRRHLAYGEEEDYFHEPNCIAWVRHGDEDHPHKMVVILSNKDARQVEVHLGEQEGGKIYRDFLGNHADEIEIGADGRVSLPVSPGSVSCWAEKDFDF